MTATPTATPAPAGVPCAHAPDWHPHAAVYVILCGALGPVALCAADARAYRYRELSRLAKADLCAMYRRGVLTPGGQVVSYGGGMHPPERWRKDEVVTSILSIEIPARCDPADPCPPDLCPHTPPGGTR